MVRFIKKIATRRLSEAVPLLEADAWWTIHENGNPGSGPLNEREFVNNGGGGGGVLYHFSVGVEGGEPTIVQIYPVNYRGVHAGNRRGNQVSIAVEVSQKAPGALSDETQEALVELGVMLFTGDARIEGMGRGYTFSPDRTCRHGDWPGANPSCPENMTARWGGIARPLAAMRERLGGDTTERPRYAEPIQYAELASDPAYIQLGGAELVRVGWRVRTTRQTPRLSYSSIDATPRGPDIEEGHEFTLRYLIRMASGELFGLTPAWTRVIFNHLEVLP